MHKYQHIGPVPTNEAGAQVGTPNYHLKSEQECVAYKRQLERQHPVPGGVKAWYAIRQFPHESGSSQRIVCLAYNEADATAVEFVEHLVENVPDKWDAHALYDQIWMVRRSELMDAVRRGSLQNKDVPMPFRDPIIPTPRGSTLSEMLVALG